MPVVLKCWLANQKWVVWYGLEQQKGKKKESKPGSWSKTSWEPLLLWHIFYILWKKFRRWCSVTDLKLPPTASTPRQILKADAPLVVWNQQYREVNANKSHCTLVIQQSNRVMIDVYQTGSQTKHVCDTEVVNRLISASGPDEHTNPRSRRIVFQGSNH